VAARITTDKEMTICSIYCPPGEQVTEDEIDELMEQLPTTHNHRRSERPQSQMGWKKNMWKRKGMGKNH
jgi:hypothetical protein